MPSRRTTKFEKLLEAVPDALVGMDQKGVIRFVNQQTESLFGFDRDDLIDQPIETLVPEPLWQIYAQNRDQYFADPRTRSSGLELELVGRHQDGSEFLINVSMSHIDTGDVLLVITAVADVTKQQVAVRNAQLIAAIVESSNDAIMSGTLDGIITSWSPGAAKMYGYSVREAVGRSGTLLFPEGQAGDMQDIMARVKEGQVVENYEATRVRKDGTAVPVSITVAPIRDENGEVVSSSAIHRDATQERHALEVAQRLAAIVQGSEDAIFGSTLRGTITSWNPAAERMFGYTGEEIIGKSGRLLSRKGRAGETRAILAEVSAGKHIEQLETVRVRKDGTVFPVSLTVSPIRDTDGAVVGASAISRDITEQKHARVFAQRMEAIIEGSDDAIIGLTLEGIITSWNRAAERMCGYSGEEIVGRSIDLLVPESRKDERRSVTAKVRAGGHVIHLETEGVRKDGTVFPDTLTVSPIRDAEGVVSGLSVVARDMSGAQQAAQYARSLIEASLDPLATIDPEGIITDVNRAAVSLTGVPRDELIGTAVSLYHTQPEKTDEIYQQVVAQGSVTDYPLTFRHRDGTLTDILCNASPYRDAGGDILGVLATAHDVTSQKKALVTARRLAAIVESSYDAIISKTLEGIITSWNPAAERMYGYRSDEIVGKPISLLHPGGRPDATDATLARIRSGQQVKHREHLHVRKDGTLFPVSFTVSPILVDGTVVGASVIHRDLTEHLLAFEAAQRMAAIIEGSDDAIIGLTLEGIITSWNPAAERIYGYSSDEIVGRPTSLLIPKDRKDEVKTILAKVKVGQPLVRLETRRVRKDGTTFPVSLSVSPIHDERGAVIGASTIHRDLTGQKKALASTEQIAAIVEHSVDAIVGRTLDGIVTSWNPAAARMFGYTSDEIVGETIDLLVPQDRAGEKIAILAKISAGRAVNSFETIRVRKDGTTLPVSLTVSPIRDEHGTVVAAAAIFRDVSELKHAAEYARSLIEADLDPLVAVSPEGTITDVNEAAVAATGVHRNKLIGTDLSLYFTEPGKVRESYQRAFAQSSVKDYPLTLRHQDGTLTEVLFNASVFRDASGNVLGVLAAARGIRAFEPGRRA